MKLTGQPSNDPGPFDDKFWLACVAKPEPATEWTPPNCIPALQRLFSNAHLAVPSPAMCQALLRSPFAQGSLNRAYFLGRFYQLLAKGSFVAAEPRDKLNNQLTLVGAVNCDNVMCYLDALVFAMFANLESFEPMLFLHSSRPSRLASLLRLNVSMLRSGNLVPTDVTRRLCEALADHGFKEATSKRQQDCAALFVFLADVLEMPLLTFKVDISHPGKFNKEDDEKFSAERILYLGIPEPEDPQSESAKGPILLEECLEHYLHNSIRVRRELRRRATLDTSDSTLADSQRPARLHSNSLSLWSNPDPEITPHAPEVSLPAHMFLRLLPFYTDGNSKEGSSTLPQTARDFAERRPLLPLCLKGYAFDVGDMKAHRLNRRVLIPPFIRLPAFVAGDAPGDGPGSNYMFVLESAVFHRGTSINEGHFVAGVRKHNDLCALSYLSPEAYTAPWYLYDDMKSDERVSEHSFSHIFDTEWPYLLFYRLVTDDSPSSNSRALLWPYGPLSTIMSRSVLLASSDQPDILPKTLATPPLDHLPSTTCSPMDETRLPNSAPEQTFSSKITDTFVPAILVSAPSESEKSTSHSASSTYPDPDNLPTSQDYIDVADRYYWYVADKETGYFKEQPSRDRSTSNNSRTPGEELKDSAHNQAYGRDHTSSGSSSITPGPPLSGSTFDVSDQNHSEGSHKKRHAFPSISLRKRHHQYRKDKCTIT